MMDHINSYKRKKLNNRSPYEAFSFYYGEDVLKKLGCSPVAAREHHPEAKTSQKVTDKFAEYRQKRTIISDQNRDGFSEYKNFERELISGCCMQIYC